jgi:hypothetical protein
MPSGTNREDLPHVSHAKVRYSGAKVAKVATTSSCQPVFGRPCQAIISAINPAARAPH